MISTYDIIKMTLHFILNNLVGPIWFVNIIILGPHFARTMFFFFVLESSGNFKTQKATAMGLGQKLLPIKPNLAYHHRITLRPNLAYHN